MGTLRRRPNPRAARLPPQAGILSAWCQVHYVPVDSPADVAAKLEWAREHDEWAQGIVANATAHMQQFAQQQQERDVVSTLLLRYKQNVHIE